MTAITPRVPAEVVTNVQERWPERADAWAGAVDAELHELCERYEVTASRVLPARYGFVVAADTPDGPIVLRSSPDPHGPEQAAVATALAGLSIAPAIYEVISSDHGTWTVLERVLPGTPLAAADPQTISLEALFSPLAAMNAQPEPIRGMPSITHWLRARLQDDQLTDLRPGTDVAPAHERHLALALIDDLEHDLIPGRCHADSSLRNIVSSGQSAWKYIDPRGMSGETAYDVAVLALRVVNVLQRGPAHALAGIANVDHDRVAGWMRVAHAARV